ncbi:hypothetical protein NDU88_003695 [Pleurodeles waltl]|uniref:Uncharacterized protein n=1 Tax=Pleurodeles waltl TaxID=8319 RepID=A0AAV7V0S3_PLEWA|nr:hypothetical protein NDU88_003695 [Pleurodeles waltl]
MLTVKLARHSPPKMENRGPEIEKTQEYATETVHSTENQIEQMQESENFIESLYVVSHLGAKPLMKHAKNY